MSRNRSKPVGLALLGLASLAGAVTTVATSGPVAAEAPRPVGAPPVPGAACVADFDRLVQPVFNIHCVECHQHVTGGGGLSLQGAGTAERIVLAPSSGAALNLVQPGRPDESYLYLKIVGRQAEVNGMGARMPLIGARLSDGTIETILSWIEGCTVVPGSR